MDIVKNQCGADPCNFGAGPDPRNTSDADADPAIFVSDL
jgi:hypothetical protein